MAKKKQTPNPDEEYDWNESEGHQEDDPQESTEPETKEEHQKEPDPSQPADENALLMKKVRGIRDRVQEEMGDVVDVVILYMSGIKRIRPYIVRSMTLEDHEKFENDVATVIRAELEERRNQAEDENRDPDQIQLTQQEYDRINDDCMVKEFCLYPPDIGELIDKKQIRPGDMAELIKAILAMSGFFPPAYDEAPTDGAIIEQTLRPSTQVE